MSFLLQTGEKQSDTIGWLYYLNYMPEVFGKWDLEFRNVNFPVDIYPFCLWKLCHVDFGSWIFGCGFGSWIFYEYVVRQNEQSAVQIKIWHGWIDKKKFQVNDVVWLYLQSCIQKKMSLNSLTLILILIIACSLKVYFMKLWIKYYLLSSF